MVDVPCRPDRDALSWRPWDGHVYADLVSVTVERLGSSDLGSHQSALAAALQQLGKEDLLELTLLSSACAFGPVNGTRQGGFESQ